MRHRDNCGRVLQSVIAHSVGFALPMLFLVLGWHTPPAHAAPEPYIMDLVERVGGSFPEQVRDIEVDAQGNIYITGGTTSSNFPTTDGTSFTPGLQTRYHDVFVTKLDPAGNIIWSTLLGGNGYERAYALELDASGNVYVGGRAGPNFPTTSGVIQRVFGGDDHVESAYGDGFVKPTHDQGRVELSRHDFNFFSGPFFQVSIHHNSNPRSHQVFRCHLLESLVILATCLSIYLFGRSSHRHTDFQSVARDCKWL